MTPTGSQGISQCRKMVARSLTNAGHRLARKARKAPPLLSLRGIETRITQKAVDQHPQLSGDEAKFNPTNRCFGLRYQVKRQFNQKSLCAPQAKQCQLDIFVRRIAFQEYFYSNLVDVVCVSRDRHHFLKCLCLLLLEQFNLMPALSRYNPYRRNNGSNGPNRLHPSRHFIHSPYRSKDDMQAPPQEAKRKKNPYNPNTCQLHTFRNSDAPHRLHPLIIQTHESMRVAWPNDWRETLMNESPRTHHSYPVSQQQDRGDPSCVA